MKTSLLAEHIREVKDFPKEGISFKDITPILSNPELSTKVIDSFIEFLNDKDIDAIVGVESRGFLFGMLLANALKVPFIPIRKAGKLPSDTIFEEYVFHNDNFAILSNLLISKNRPFFENLVSFLDFDIQT